MDERAQQLLILALNVAIVFVLVSAVFALEWHLISFEPFSHDEAVYLTKARAWLIATPADQWGVYRPIGLSVVAWVLLHFGHSEVYLRSFGIMCGMATIAIYFLFVRKISNLWVAIASVFVTGGSILFMQQVPQFLDDVAAAGFLIALMWCIWIYFKSSGHSNAIYFAAPAAAAAFYIRYGSASPLIVVTLCTVFLLVPRFFRDEDAQYDKFAKTVFIAIALFAPHFIYSIATTKEFFGILKLAGDAAHRDYIGGGLAQYIRWLPQQLGGWPLDVAAMIGATATIAFFALKNLRERHIALVWTGTIGIGTFILTGLLVHAEQRYVLFPLMLLSAVGISAIYHIAARLSPIASGAVIALTCIAATYFGVGYFNYLNDYYATREDAPLSLQYSKAHDAIVQADTGKPCAIWEVQFQPRASWYTGCEIPDLNNFTQFQKQVQAHPDFNLYAVEETKLKNLQLTPETAAQFSVSLTEIFRAPGQNGDDIVVYSVHPIATSTPSALSPGIPPQTQP